MICKRCDCIITRKTRHVKVNTSNSNWVWCRHCYKAIQNETPALVIGGNHA